MNIDQIKQKIEDIKRREKELTVREEVVASILPAYKSLGDKVKERVTSNSAALIGEAVTNAISDIKIDTSDIAKSIEEKINIVEDKTSKAVLTEVRDMFIKIKELENKTYFDQNVFDNVFNEGIEKITNILVSQSAIPNNTTYDRALIKGVRKIVKVIEEYDEYSLIYSWIYDKSGDLSRIETRKK